MIPESANKSIWARVEGPCLIGISLVLTMSNVFAQWTGIATDPSFTAWIAPISNRLKTGPRLYEWGTHMPLPPLSHVLLYLVSWGHATWLTESFAHQIAAMLSILILYFYMRDIFPRPVSFLAAIAAASTASTAITILFYNSLTQLLVICAAVFATNYFRDAKRAASALKTENAAPRWWRWLVPLGLSSAAALLSKQSIGGMTIIGCAAVIGLAPAPGGIRARVQNVVLYGVATGAAFGLLCLLMYPWVNPRGLIQDVFIIGSECKGGTSELLGKIGGFSKEMISLFGLTFFVVLVIVGSKLYATSSAQGSAEPKLDRTTRTTAIASILFFVLIVAGMAVHKSIFMGMLIFESVGLGACLFAIATIALPVLRSVPAWREFACEPWPTVGCLTLVFLPAAMGYNLSGIMLQRDLNWCSDSIPLFQLAMAPLFWLIISASKAICRGASARLTAAVVTGATAILLLCSLWPWPGHWKMLRQCTDTWADCAWFKGAKVTTSATALHEVVQRVRVLAGTNGTVLLLPEDPNFEECLARPRPALSCAIVYTDQYWKRYVKTDFQFLSQNPPKVVIIGPENAWRPYSSLRNDSKAVEGLADRLQNELLPTRYHLEFRQTIPFGRGTDTMAVYVRND